MNSFSLGFNSVEQTALKGIRQSTAGIVQSVTRLSTGKRINSAKDDPAGLIAAELLKSENTELRAKLKATKELGNQLAVKDSYLSQIGNLLTDIKGAVVEGANTGALSDSEIDALQLQIDYSLDAIQRMDRTATYKGEKLFDGLFQSLGKTFGGFSNLSGFGSSSEASTCTVQTDSTGILRTDALSGLTETFFTGDEEDTTGIAELVELLQLLAKSLEGGGSAVELPEEEIVDDESETEDTEELAGETAEELASDELAAETEAIEQQTTVVEENAETATETMLEEESDPFMEFFEAERQQDEAAFLSDAEIPADEVSAEETGVAAEADIEIDDETDGVPAVYEVTEADVEATEEEAEETIEEEKKEFDPASTFLSGQPGDYWFRELDEFDFLNYKDSEETMATAATIIAGLSSDKIAALENLLIPNSYSLNTLKIDNGLETEGEESEEDEPLGGGLADLYSNGAASLRNDPEKADRIIDEAIRGVSMMRAQIGAEQKYTVDVNTTLFEDQLVANTSTLSELTDADYAEEMSNLARYQILLQVNMKVLGYSQNMTRMMVDMLDSSVPSVQ